MAQDMFLIAYDFTAYNLCCSHSKCNDSLAASWLPE